MDKSRIKTETQQVIEDVLEKAGLREGSLFVLGLSSSEVLGGHIGKESSQEIGEIIVKTILDILNVRWQSSLVWKSSVSFLLSMQEVQVSWQPSSL